jgi:hypothetical protein
MLDGGPLLPQHGASLVYGLWDGLQLWKTAVNILNKQPWTNDKGWSSILGVWHEANNPSS